MLRGILLSAQPPLLAEEGKVTALQLSYITALNRLAFASLKALRITLAGNEQSYLGQHSLFEEGWLRD